MSFFGFDPQAGPPAKSEALDFNSLEEDDAFNDETFGTAAVSNLNNDFDFSLNGISGNSTKNANNKASLLKPAPAPTNTGNLSYATAAHSTVDEILQPMASLWGNDEDKIATANAATQTSQHISPAASTVMSLEEIEAKLKAHTLPTQSMQMPMQQQTQQSQQSQQQMNPNVMQNPMPNAPPPPQFQFPPYITQMLYQPAVQQQIYSAVSSGRFPNFQIATQAMVQMLMASAAQNPMMQMPPASMNVPQNMPQQQQQQQSLPQQPQQPQQQVPPAHHDHPSQMEHPHKKVDLSAFPSLEVANAKGHLHVNHTEHVSEQSPEPETEVNQNEESQRFNDGRHHNNNFNTRMQQHSYNNNNNHFRNNNGNGNYGSFRDRQLREQLNNMSPDERKVAMARQRKVAQITRCSGFMTPKDKDFVTRFQLSQIVTDDPYNEDFYSQVYKIINSGAGENNMNSLAQKYLEQSGHRLGGRSKRADIALQRMQQQVSKAVSVAKERGESTGILTKAGALGKVSYGTGKQPRKQLIIHTNEEQASEPSTEATGVKPSEVIIPTEYTFSRSSRAFQLTIIEKIYNEVLKLESLERENQPFDTAELWKSLHLNDVIKTSSNESVNPFISVLAFDKMMKVFNRAFHFFSPEQKTLLISQMFQHLQNIDVIRQGSYKNYEESNYEIPDEIIKKIDLFQMTILKTLVIFISEANFQTVFSWVNTLVVNKTILFLSTTKIGLSLITVLISRLELIKQEFTDSLGAHDLAQWQTVYNQMFESLEGRLESCFPPYLSHDESRKVINKESKEDDSYIWQFLTSLSLTGMLNHQRIIVDEIRNEIFGIMAVAKELKASGDAESSARYLSNLNLFLNAMGLIATEDDITQLSE